MSYEPKKFPVDGTVKQIVFAGKALALCGKTLVEIDCANECVFPTEKKAKLLAADKKSCKIFIIDEADSLVVLNSGLLAEKAFKRPDDLAHTEIVSLYPVNEWDVLLGLETVDKAQPFINLYHVDVSSSSAPWTEYFDPTRPRSKNPSSLLFSKLSGWDKDLSDFVVIANASSADLGTVGRLLPEDPFSTFFLTTEEYIPQLPVSIRQSRSDQLPVGIVFDFTNPELTPAGSDLPPFPASPVLWILTNEGCLCSYRIIKNNSRTQYGEINLNVTEFPNILKKRPSKLRPHREHSTASLDQRQAKVDAELVVEEKAEKIDFTSVSAGYVEVDFGKYTNALIEVFLGLYNLVQNDFKSMSVKSDETKETFIKLKELEWKEFYRLERDTLKLAQNCDNSAFLKLFKIEKSIHELAQQIVSYRSFSLASQKYTQDNGHYQRNLEKHHQSMEKAVDGLIVYAKQLIAAKEAALKKEVSIEAVTKDTKQLMTDLLELEQNMSMLRLSQATGNQQHTSTSTRLNPTKAQIASFAEKWKKKNPADLLHAAEIIDLSKPLPLSKKFEVPVNPDFYTKVFPEYREDDWILDETEEEKSPSLPVMSPVEELIERDYDVSSISDDDDYQECSFPKDTQINTVDEVNELERSADGSEVILETDIEEVETDETEVKAETERTRIYEKPSVLYEAVVPTEAPEESNVAAEKTSTYEELDDSLEANIVDRAIEYVPEESKEESDENVLEEKKYDPKACQTGTEKEQSSDKKYEDYNAEAPEIHKEEVAGTEYIKIENSSREDFTETIQDQETKTENLKVSASEQPVIETDIDKNRSKDNVRTIANAPEVIADDALMESFEVLDTAQIEESRNVSDGFTFMSVSDVPSIAKSPPSIPNVFSVPFSSSLTPATSFTPPSTTGGPFVKPPVLSAFAPKPEESIFGKSSFGSSTIQQRTTISAFGSTQQEPVPSFGQTSSFGQPSFGQSSFGQPSTFGQSSAFGQSTFVSQPVSQPAKVFGQNSSMTAGVSGFGALASQPSTFGQEQPNSEQEQKKNIPSSFTQFRG